MPTIFRPTSWPLAVRTAVDLLFAAVIPMGLAVLLLGARGVGAVESAAERNLELAARALATQVDQILHDVRVKLRMIANDERVVSFCAGDADTRAAFRQPIQEQLAQIRRDDIDVGSIFITDGDGIGINSTHEHNIGQDLTFREYWRRARAGEQHISDLLVGTRSGEPGIYFSAPVLHDGTIFGVVVLKLDGRRLHELIDAVEIPHGRAVISNSHGVILAHPRPEFVYRSFGPLDESVRAAIDPELTFGIPSIDDVGLIELMAPMTSGRGGAATFDRIENGRSERWVTGHAPLAMLPWMASISVPVGAFDAPLALMVRQQTSVAVVLTLLAGIYATFRGIHLVRPLLSLTEAARRLADGDLEVRVAEHDADEVGRLGAAFNAMIPQLRERVELRRSMLLAGQMQDALLPMATSVFAGIEVCGRSTPCGLAGIDYYDFIDIATKSDGGFVVIGDVMGHGVGSALVMASARGALRAAIADGEDLGTIVGKLNRIVKNDIVGGGNMTLLLMCFDVEAEEVQWISAGHDPPLLLRAGEAEVDELAGIDLPLGVDVHSQFVTHRFPLPEPGSLILLGTDGLWEATNGEGEPFGKDRALELLLRHRDDSAESIGDAFDRAIRTFTMGARLQDDVTFVVMRFTERSSNGG